MWNIRIPTYRYTNGEYRFIHVIQNYLVRKKDFCVLRGFIYGSLTSFSIVKKVQRNFNRSVHQLESIGQWDFCLSVFSPMLIFPHLLSLKIHEHSDSQTETEYLPSFLPSFLPTHACL